EIAILCPLPEEFLHDRLASADHVANGTLCIRKRLLPPLAQLHIGICVFDASLCARFFIDNIGCQGRLEARPVTGIESLDEVLCDLGKVSGLLACHRRPPRILSPWAGLLPAHS